MTDLLDFFERRHDGNWVCTRRFPGVEKGTVVEPGFRFMGVELIPILEQMAWERDG